MDLDGAYELLADVELQLAEIDKVYAQAVTKDSIASVARPKVKSCLEHLRSVLEYVKSNLAATLPPPAKPKKGNAPSCFPYGRNAKLYQESLDRNLPGLDAKYRTLVDGLQPHICGDSWLVHLAEATNFNKHVDLQPQVRKNIDPRLSIGRLVQISGNASVDQLVLEGTLVNPKGPLTTETPAADLVLPASLPVRKEYGAVKFMLKGQGVDVLELLKQSHQRISLFVAELARV